MTARRIAAGIGVALFATLGGSGCVYYNAMWSAEQYAKGARKLEEQGLESEARSEWAQAAAKADAVVVKHPKSRWVDDALVLEAEGLARSGACADADDVIARARAITKDVALRERTDLAVAHCALAAGRPVQADAALVDVLKSKDRGRRSRAEYLAGRAAALRLDYPAAADYFGRSREPAARPARAEALLALGRSAQAAALIDTIGGDPRFETERADLLAKLATVGGAELASATLDRVLAHARMPYAEHARLLIADGDRRLAQGEYEIAQARYRRAGAVAPLVSTEASLAHVRMQRALAMQATQVGDLAPIIEELSSMTRMEGGAPAPAPAPDAKQLLDQLSQAVSSPPSAGARFRVAEVVRDSLGASALAGQLFLDVAAADTGSVYAPKALVAALVLLPDRRDSITRILDTRYAGSPYTLAYHGEASVAYAAAEDSLAHELGVAVARAVSVTSLGVQSSIPIPGIRGPRLDEPVAAAARPMGPPATPARPGARPTPANTRDRPALPERP